MVASRSRGMQIYCKYTTLSHWPSVLMIQCFVLLDASMVVILLHSYSCRTCLCWGWSSSVPPSPLQHAVVSWLSDFGAAQGFRLSFFQLLVACITWWPMQHTEQKIALTNMRVCITTIQYIWAILTYTRLTMDSFLLVLCINMNQQMSSYHVTCVSLWREVRARGDCTLT